MRGVTAAHFCLAARPYLAGARGTAIALSWTTTRFMRRTQSMRSTISVLLIIVFLCSGLAAQSARVPESATKPIQPSDSAAAISTPAQPPRELKLPAGTSLDIEATYTVSSIDFRPGDYLSFRVLVPVMIDGITLIDK